MQEDDVQSPCRRSNELTFDKEIHPWMMTDLLLASVITEDLTLKNILTLVAREKIRKIVAGQAGFIQNWLQSIP